jgi:hypothetical protein
MQYVNTLGDFPDLGKAVGSTSPTCISVIGGVLMYKGGGTLTKAANPDNRLVARQNQLPYPKNMEVVTLDAGTANETYYVFQSGMWYVLTKCGSYTKTITRNPSQLPDLILGSKTADAQKEGLPPCVKVLNGVMLYTGTGTLYEVTAPENRLTVNSTLFNNSLVDNQVVVLDLGTAREAWYVYILGKWYYLANCTAYNQVTPGMEQAKAKSSLLPCITYKNGKYYYSGTGLSDFNINQIPSLLLGFGWFAGSKRDKAGQAATIREEFEAVPYFMGTDQEYWLIWRSGKWWKMIKCGDVYPAEAVKKTLPVVDETPVVKTDPQIGTGINPILTTPVGTTQKPVVTNPQIGTSPNVGVITQPKITLPPCIQLVNGSYYFSSPIAATFSSVSSVSQSPTAGIKAYSTIPLIEQRPDVMVNSGIGLNDGLLGLGDGFGSSGFEKAVAQSDMNNLVMETEPTKILPTAQLIPARVVDQGKYTEKWYAQIDGLWLEIINCEVTKPIDVVVKNPEPEVKREALPPCIQITTAPWHGIFTNTDGQTYPADSNKTYNGKADTWHAFVNNEWIPIVNCAITKPVVQKETLPFKPVVSVDLPQQPVEVITPQEPVYPSPVVQYPDPVYPSPVVQYPDPVVQYPDPVYPSPVVQPQPEDCGCETKKLSMPKMIIYEYPKDGCRNEFY